MPSNQDDNPCTSNIDWSDAQLGSLADNGGTTPTLMPQPSSPANGAGMGCPAFDQRGEPRPSSGCTAGAVELP